MAHPRQLASRIIFYYTRAFTRARDVRTNTRALTRTRRKLDARVEAGRLQTRDIRACACPVPVHAPGYTRYTHPGRRRLAAAMRSSRVSLPGSATPPPTEALGSTGPDSCRASTNARSESPVLLSHGLLCPVPRLVLFKREKEKFHTHWRRDHVAAPRDRRDAYQLHELLSKPRRGQRSRVSETCDVRQGHPMLRHHVPLRRRAVRSVAVCRVVDTQYKWHC